MSKRPKSQGKNEQSSQSARRDALIRMQTLLVSEHEIACSYIPYLLSDVQLLAHTPEEKRAIIQAGLEKYATVTHKMLSLLEKMTDHEQLLDKLAATTTADDTQDETPTELQWDLLIQHAHRQLQGVPLLPRVPVKKTTSEKDIS